jgi:hypothetical protein
MAANKFTIGLLALACGILFVAGTALANHPSTVAGSWKILGNHTAGQMTITQYPGTANSTHKPIRGWIYGVDMIEGFYCPASGRICFVRYYHSTPSPKQFWTGNLSDTTGTLRMGGTITVVMHDNTAGTIGGALGESNFSATKSK